jgi:hypothetical protein
MHRRDECAATRHREWHAFFGQEEVTERAETKQASTACWPVKCGGGGEIRTLGWFPIGGFQDRCLKPLGHPSVLKLYCIGKTFIFAALLPRADKVAEEERFELSDGFPSAVFKTAALSRSATPPQ